MCYMIEGESSKTFLKARKFLHQHSQTSSRLLQQLTDLIVDYLVLQVRAGAQVKRNTDFKANKVRKQAKEICLSISCKMQNNEMQ